MFLLFLIRSQSTFVQGQVEHVRHVCSQLVVSVRLDVDTSISSRNIIITRFLNTLRQSRNQARTRKRVTLV